jgi:hypothetical protein
MGPHASVLGRAGLLWLSSGGKPSGKDHPEEVLGEDSLNRGYLFQLYPI